MSEKLILSKRTENRIQKAVSLNEEIREREDSFERTDAVRLARLIAITSLPAKRSNTSKRVKVFRLGKDLWVQVVLSVEEGKELPFGQDRFVLAGVMHLSIEQNSPIVFFKHACDLLKMFEISQNNLGYSRLRERFRRISDLSIRIKYGDTEEGLTDNSFGENMFVIHKYALPTRKEIEDEKRGQMFIPGIHDNPDLNDSPYGVKLGSEFWDHLKEPKNQLIIPLNLLKLFIDQPIGWDYATFLVARCGAAKQSSAIDHETLMSLFKDGREPDRNTIARLMKYHRQLMIATNNRLQAEIIEDGYFPREGRGPKKKRWKLLVGPSEKIVWSGKKPNLLQANQN